MAVVGFILSLTSPLGINQTLGLSAHSDVGERPGRHLSRRPGRLSWSRHHAFLVYSP